MKYENAQEVLPKEVIELIQKYTDGSYIYVPVKSENKKAWGEDSGAKKDLRKRNNEIFNKYNNGTSVKDLSKAYYLTEHSIRRIIRQEKKKIAS